MPEKHPESVVNIPVNLTEKSLMLRPKSGIINRENFAIALRTFSITLALTVGILLLYVFVFPFLNIRDPFILFFPAVAFISWYIGYRAGLVMIFMTTLVIMYFLLSRTYGWVHTVPDYLHLGFCVLGALGINYLIEKSKHPEIVKRYEKREKEYQQVLFALHKDYQKAKEEIRARDEFLSIASHELKTPLSAMLLQLQTVLHNVRNVSLANFSVENLLKMLDSAEQQSRRLSKMINDLLNVSLITTGRLDLEKEHMDLSQTVTDCIQRIEE